MIAEQRLARLWHDRALPAALYTSGGQSLHVIYPGTWTRADGPDFRAALLDIGGRLVRGDVELHLRTSGWNAHGHQHDPAYDGVVLHVVLSDDQPNSATTSAGVCPPTLVVSAFVAPVSLEDGDDTANGMPPSLGQSTCLPTLAGGQEAAVRNILRRAGWQRISARSVRYRQQMEALPAGEVLWRGLLDALGLMENREPMATLAERLPLREVERVAGNPHHCAALLLAAAGLPPRDAREATGIGLDAAAWGALVQVATTAHIEPLTRDAWTLHRVRPANHPARRLLSLASLLGHAPGHDLMAAFSAATHDGWQAWEQWLAAARPTIGSGRARQIMTNVLAPFGVAWADTQGDAEQVERMHAIWEQLPGAADDQIARTTLRQIVGEQRFPIRSMLENQGLHQIGREGCRELRCFECPIAALAVQHEPSHRLLREESGP